MFGFGPRRGRRRSARQVAINQLLERLRPAVRAVLCGGGALAVTVGIGVALLSAEQYTHKRMPFARPSRFVLANVPAPLEPLIAAELTHLGDIAWIDPQLCYRVALRLQQNPWVREVTRISKRRPGVVEVHCAYRSPAALVQEGEYLYLIDEYGIRLPGHYPYQPDLIVLQGVEAQPPEPGQPWPGADLAAGLELANLLGRQVFGRQVTAILLHNHGGRRDPYRCHVELIAGERASRILWGSAPGEELEENTVAQKIHILAENYHHHGRIDGGHPIIDVSVFPDRYLIPS